jgi:putative transposon-encoded protein
MVQEANIPTEPADSGRNSPDEQDGKVKLEIYGEEMIEKVVKQSGNSGRVYLPPNWVGSRVKIIRLGKEVETEP